MLAIYNYINGNNQWFWSISCCRYYIVTTYGTRDVIFHAECSLCHTHNFLSRCTVPNMAVVYSSLILCFLITSLRYFLN